MSLRDVLMAPVLNNTLLLAALGDGQNSVLPRAGIKPPAKPPWLLFKNSTESVIDARNPIYRVGGFEWWVYDDPGQEYYRIDDIIGMLLKLYPYDPEVVYLDDSGGGQAFFPRLVTIGVDTVDDEWTQDLKIVAWSLWRDNP
jgi:hypothetical protein